MVDLPRNWRCQPVWSYAAISSVRELARVSSDVDSDQERNLTWQINMSVICECLSLASVIPEERQNGVGNFLWKLLHEGNATFGDYDF